MTARLIGGPDLRARLASLGSVGPEFAAQWADDTAKRMRTTAPPSQREASKVFTTKVGRARAAVYGAYWWIFVDRGSKAHTIEGSGGKNPPENLKFSLGGRTIFAKSVRHPRTARRPFITHAAQDALGGSRFADLVIQTWNRRKLRSHKVFL